MSETLNDLILDSLSQPMPAIGYYLNRRLRALYPDKAIVEGIMAHFNVEAYAAEGRCELRERAVPQPERILHWVNHTEPQVDRAHNVFFDVVWEGERLHVLIMHWVDQISSSYHYSLVADSRDVAERFHAAVCAWNAREPDEYIMVFDMGGWQKDQALLEAIKNATLDNLVLRGTLKDDILGDIRSFFAARDTYAEYGIPWKRGILFVGPAGNGKTHAVKALINALGHTCLYVKTFGGVGPDQMGIRAIFDMARHRAPCVLVLEDLDSLITPTNRSYFLNELDGFAGNDGILTLATTNHPDRLDPAIINRPSRFDRKYPFDLPELPERAAYVVQWNETLRPALRLSPDVVTFVAEATEGFSFAYLKELFLSAMMRWIASPEPGAMDGVMSEQVMVLREQMASIEELPSDPGYSDQMIHPAGMVRRGLVGRRSGPMHDGPYPGDVPM